MDAVFSVKEKAVRPCLLRLAFAGACLSLVSLTACSSSSGGGSEPPRQPASVVIPPGSTVICSDGTQPPCR